MSPNALQAFLAFLAFVVFPFLVLAACFAVLLLGDRLTEWWRRHHGHHGHPHSA